MIADLVKSRVLPRAVRSSAHPRHFDTACGCALATCDSRRSKRLLRLPARRRSAVQRQLWISSCCGIARSMGAAAVDKWATWGVLAALLWVVYKLIRFIRCGPVGSLRPASRQWCCTRHCNVDVSMLIVM